MKNSLTCNQNMILMDIYRGTFLRKRHMAQVDADVGVLIRAGLVEWEKGELEVTEEGWNRVEWVLTGPELVKK
jgi:hypothetical protein